ncbi:MAG: arginine deiminase family protein [Candidatus Iainarchaeum sp.]|jgi:hypothetical protein|nr:MAG: hypothetical protein BWY55_00121 [archaeon ADurb.Bin336]
MRKKFYVTSLASKKQLIQASQELAKKGIKSRAVLRINSERMGVIKLLAKSKKRVIITIPQSAPKQQIEKLRRVIEAIKKETKNTMIKLVPLSENNYYNAFWERDVFTRMGKRILNKSRATDLKTNSQKEKRFFGDGGRIINAGKVNGKEVLLVASSPQHASKRKLGVQKNLVNEEIEMLTKRGYLVFELPGFNYKRLGRTQGSKATNRFFEHIDVFINTIPQKKVMLVDPDYYAKHSGRITKIAQTIGFKLIKVPVEERYFYPSNFLNIGNGEIIMDKKATRTAKLLEKAGVKVYTTPSTLEGNNLMFGGVRCFVNTD